MKYSKLLFLLLTIFCLPLSGYGESILVSSMDELKKAAKNLNPGDTLELSEGEWESVELSLRARGTEEAPIVVKGASNGNTVITGRSWIGIGGHYITVRDLHFKGVEPPSSVEGIVQFRDSGKREAEHSRLSNCVFESCNPKDLSRRYKWVQIYGVKNRVDHTVFANQQHNGVAIQVRMAKEDVQHQIDHNHFIDRAEGDGNGFEMIQVGQSQDSENVGNCLVENNLFERCDGEIEIISNKTCGNVYRGNVFLESKGSLTLRHGNDCIVEGNVFIGNGKEGSTGLRIVGSGHVVKGNYFEGLYGRTGGVIVLYTGIPKSPLNGYFAADNVSIDNNLLVNSAGNAMYLLGGYGEKGRDILPTGVKISDNLVHLSVGGAALFVGDLPDVEFKGNIAASGKEVGRVDLTGIEKQKIKLARNESGLLDAFGENGAKAFQFKESAPRLLDRSEVGATWFTVHPLL